MLSKSNDPRNGFVYSPLACAPYVMMPADAADADPTPPTTHDDEPVQLCFEFRYRRSGL